MLFIQAIDDSHGILPIGPALMQEPSIAIIGAGIGGLCTALAMQRAGLRVRVYEQAPKLAEVGAGLSLSPTAAHALNHLGLGEFLRERATMPEEQFARHYRDGRLLMLSNRGRSLLERFGERYYLIHRADLHGALAAAVHANDADAIQLAKAVRGLRRLEPHVEIEMADGSIETAAACIAADGQRSSVRTQIFSPEQPRFTGYVAWRALIPMEHLSALDLQPSSGIFIGPGHMVNVYPVQRGRLLNLVAFAERNTWTEEGWSIPAQRDELLEEFSGWTDTVRFIMMAIADGALFRWGLFDRTPLERWTEGHLALLGDAAHPVLPFLGHGAVLAIEDAVVLARCFATGESIPAALHRYEIARRERARFVFEESRKAVRIFHASDPDRYSRSVGNVTVDEGLGLFAYNPVNCAI
ncbi:MAG: FAD-dependent monooxygenase [Steroidobacteraceae bacterium]